MVDITQSIKARANIARAIPFDINMAMNSSEILNLSFATIVQGSPINRSNAELDFYTNLGSYSAGNLCRMDLPSHTPMAMEGINPKNDTQNHGLKI